MASIEQRFISAILTMIRARRQAPSAPANLQVHSSAGLAPARIREASFSDFNAVSKLKQRWGMNADSLENWQRLWRRNPALLQKPCHRPIGWVLEADGSIVGYLGNISLLCRYGDRTLTAVTSHGLVVDLPYRAVGLSLTAAFFRQKSVDLFLCTSAIESVGKMALAFKSASLPQPEYDTVLFWVLQPYPFAQALMKKLELGPAPSRVGGILAALAVGTDKILRRRWPGRSATHFALSEISAEEIGDEFGTLGLEKVNGSPRLVADRSPVALRWHFEIPGDRGCARVLCCRRNDELVGYAVVRSDTDEHSGLRSSMIADMVARQDNPEIVAALWVAAYEQAKYAGSHILEVVGFPPSIRNACSRWNPYHRRYPASPFFYKAADPVLHKTLADSTAWYACPFDGDATLIRPSYPDSALPGNSGTQIEANGYHVAPEAQEETRIEAF